jgi:endonuclease/exonuclease/phosphatase (EEP) superfamily protein YafD
MLLALVPWVRSAYDTRTAAPTREALSVLWANVDRLNEHRSEALAAIAASDADLIGLTEVYPDDRSAFSHDRWPYQFWTDRTWAKDCALLSKKPFVLSKQRIWTRIETIDAVLDVNDHPLRVLVAHLDTPVESAWAVLRDREFHDLVTALGDFNLPDTPAADLPVLVMGDLNATPATHLWQPLLAVTGLSRAPGLTPPTYPAWLSPWPWTPGIPIDHILVRHGRLAPLEAVIVPGSDHRGLRTTWGWK